MSQIDGFYQQPHFNSPIHQHQQQQQGLYGPGPGPIPPHQQQPAFSHNRVQHQQQYQPQQSPGPNVSHGLPSAAHMMQQGFPHQGTSSGSQHQPQTYTTAGFSPSIATPSSGPRQGLPQAPSPSQHNFPSPNQTIGQNTQQPPMAAPATPQATQALQQSPRNSVHSQSQPPSPGQPVPPGREKERITLLLEVNAELLQEIHNLQAQGKGGAQTPAQAEAFRSKGLPDAMASNDYLQILCRLHANLGYLCAQSDMQSSKPGSKTPHPPSYMKAPPNMPRLEEKYTELRRLFPGWVGRDGSGGAQTNSGAVVGQGMGPA